MATFYKIATNNEPDNYSITITKGPKWAIGISRISNVYPSLPIQVSDAATGDNNPVGAPSVTTTEENALILCFYTNKKHVTYTPAGGTMEIYDHPNTVEGIPSNMLATFVQAVPGASGKKDANASESERWVAQQVAVSGLAPLPVR